MALFIASLNSGSNGNCYYISNGAEAVLVDAGLTCSETERRMNNLLLSFSTVKAIFISHEHIDHIRGAAQLSKKFQIPVYINSGTLRHAGLKLQTDLIKNFRANEKIKIGELYITPFAKHHDASEPVSFVAECGGIKTGVITDIGHACKTVIHYFKQCHACFLESNYDDKMLMQGSYPRRLKKRISGNRGHLSNTQALELFANHKPHYMTHIFLSHLSENNNHPGLVYNLFQLNSSDVQVVVASRDEESAVYEIDGKERSELISLPVEKETLQLNLF